MRGLKGRRRSLAAVAALVVLGIAGCESEPVRFNNTLAEYNRRLAAAGRQMGEAMRPALQGSTVDADRVRACHEAAWETLKEIKQEFATLKVPPTESGRRLAAGYQKFLRGQEEMIRDDLGRIVRMLQRPSQARSSSQTIITILLNLQSRERRELTALQNLQREFAREHKLPLLPAR
jgi:hypothetical protein